jgi:ferrous iron transport protein B
MEDSGYMARAAFVIDRLMISIGLPGNAFVPLIVGFGCNVPAVMASRTLPSAQDRLMTMAMAPFMSCGARLTVYALFATVFFRDSGQNIVFLLYLLGIGMAIFTGWIFRKQIFSGQISPSFAEMPVYHIPNPRNIFMTTWLRLKSFVVRAGRTILVVVLALSMLNSMALDGTFGHQDSDRSVLAMIGKRITPLFAPMGIEENNWPATVGLFTGLFAKEAVVGTLDALYSGGAEEAPAEILDGINAAFASIGENLLALADAVGDPLGLAVISETEPEHQATRDNMIQQFGGAFPAFCYLVFILLYAPCVAVVAAMTKEAGWRWSALVFLWTTGLGYLTATTIYQVGVFAEHPQFSGLWIGGALISLTVMIILMKRLGARAVSAQLIPVVQITA